MDVLRKKRSPSLPSAQLASQAVRVSPYGVYRECALDAENVEKWPGLEELLFLAEWKQTQ